MTDTRVIRCASCGSPLEVETNRAFIFCKYCGCRNIIEDERMKANVNIQGVRISGNTDIESIINSVRYAISIQQYDKASELIMTSLLTGTDDYRIYILQAQIDLLTDENASLFRTLDILKDMERKQGPGKEVTNAICQLMRFRGISGITILHNATFHERLEDVKYCVEHGSDVNCECGMNRVTPISIMFVRISPSSSKLDGTPFIRDKAKVKEIRSYLMQHGAWDTHRRGY